MSPRLDRPPKRVPVCTEGVDGSVFPETTARMDVSGIGAATPVTGGAGPGGASRSPGPTRAVSPVAFHVTPGTPPSQPSWGATIRREKKDATT